MSPVPLFWQRCLAAFRDELTPQQFNTWIRPLAVEGGDGGYRLLAPNRFVLQWVKERFADRIGELAAAEGEAMPIALVVRDAPTDARVAPSRPSGADESSPPDPTVARRTPAAAPVFAPTAMRRNEQTSLNPGFTFASFVAGKANQLARAAGMQVAEHPTSYNPLFVYGGVGLGKTHLVQAIGNDILQRNPGARDPLLHAETYVSDVVRAYQHKAFDDFKRYYRSLDLLLIDDIQFFGGKSRTQEEFFYLFNTLIEAHKQVVITCDTYPKEISGLEERLISRFGWGLTVALEPPELEMRVAILLSKAAASGFEDRRAGRVLHRQAHSLERARTRGGVEARRRLLELPRPGHHARRRQGSVARPPRRAEPADLDREHPENGGRLLQDPHLGHAFEEADACRRAAAAGRHGAGEGADATFAARNR